MKKLIVICTSIIVSAILCVSAFFAGMNLAPKGDKLDTSEILSRLDELLNDPQKPTKTDIDELYAVLERIVTQLESQSTSQVDFGELHARLDDLSAQISQLQSLIPNDSSTSIFNLLNEISARLAAIESRLAELEQGQAPTTEHEYLLDFPFTETFTINGEFVHDGVNNFTTIRFSKTGGFLLAPDDCRFVVLEEPEISPMIFSLQMVHQLEIRIIISKFNGGRGIIFNDENGNQFSRGESIGTFRYGTFKLQVYRNGIYYNPRDFFDFTNKQPKAVTL